MALMVGALAIRIVGISEWWLNPDEGIYYSLVTRARFAGFWEEVAANAHPPLYYLLLRGLGVLSWDFVWFRVLSLLFGVVAVGLVWVIARRLSNGGAAGTVAALTAGLLLAFSPGAVELSQVVRPYTLQMVVLGAALLSLLRYLDASADQAASPDEAPAGIPVRELGWYVVFVLLALLTHYSSALALAAFGLVVLHDGAAHGTRRRAWRTVFAVHALPAVVLGVVYLTHLRTLMGSDLAEDALDGWLAPYMIGGLRDAWLAFLGFQHLIAVPWLRGVTAILTLGALGVSVVVGPRRPAVLLGSAFLVALVAAALGLYPLGSTRHSAWLLVFAVPVLGWGVGWALGRAGASGRLALVGLAVLLTLGGPLGAALGDARAPWAPSERVLRRANLAQMVDLLDPQATPELVVMSAQTFYLLLPFYPMEREQATEAADGSLFHFPWGRRQVLVSEAWDFTAGSDPDAPDHLAAILERAGRVFPELSLHERAQGVLLVGGWRPPLLDELVAADRRTPFIASQRSVAGLYAMLLDLPGLDRAFRGAADP